MLGQQTLLFPRLPIGGLGGHLEAVRLGNCKGKRDWGADHVDGAEGMSCACRAIIATTSGAIGSTQVSLGTTGPEVGDADRHSTHIHTYVALYIFCNSSYPAKWEALVAHMTKDPFRGRARYREDEHTCRCITG